MAVTTVATLVALQVLTDSKAFALSCGGCSCSSDNGPAQRHSVRCGSRHCVASFRFIQFTWFVSFRLFRFYRLFVHLLALKATLVDVSRPDNNEETE